MCILFIIERIDQPRGLCLSNNIWSISRADCIDLAICHVAYTQRAIKTHYYDSQDEPIKCNCKFIQMSSNYYCGTNEFWIRLLVLSFVSLSLFSTRVGLPTNFNLIVLSKNETGFGCTKKYVFYTYIYTI